MVKLIMVTGLPGTGKTTFARKLAEALDAVHLNTDMVREAMGVRGQYDDATKEAVYAELRRRVAAALDDGARVVVDGTFYLRSLRLSFRRLASARNIEHHWIELRADEAVIRELVAGRRPDSDADFSVYLKIKDIYEPIREPHTELWSDRLPLAEMVAQTSKKINLAV